MSCVSSSSSEFSVGLASVSLVVVHVSVHEFSKEIEFLCDYLLELVVFEVNFVQKGFNTFRKLGSKVI